MKYESSTIVRHWRRWTRNATTKLEFIFEIHFSFDRYESINLLLAMRQQCTFCTDSAARLRLNRIAIFSQPFAETINRKIHSQTVCLSGCLCPLFGSALRQKVELRSMFSVQYKNVTINITSFILAESRGRESIIWLSLTSAIIVIDSVVMGCKTNATERKSLFALTVGTTGAAHSFYYIDIHFSIVFCSK